MLSLRFPLRGYLPADFRIMAVDIRTGCCFPAVHTENNTEGYKALCIAADYCIADIAAGFASETDTESDIAAVDTRIAASAVRQRQILSRSFDRSLRCSRLSSDNWNISSFNYLRTAP